MFLKRGFYAFFLRYERPQRLCLKTNLLFVLVEKIGGITIRTPKTI